MINHCIPMDYWCTVYQLFGQSLKWCHCHCIISKSASISRCAWYPRWHLLIPADVHRISWGDMRDAKRDKTSKHC